MGLIARWQGLRSGLCARGVSLVAVSKYAEEDAVAALVQAGQIDFAESRPQQLRDRALRYPDAQWHMIGPLQKNKAKYIGRHAAMWHSAEDVQTARAVAEHVQGRVLPVLIQVNMAGVAHQHGVPAEAVPDLLAGLLRMPQLKFSGLMCMAPRQSNASEVFAGLRGLREELLNGSLCLPCHPLLCMGMSGDYRIAVEQGSDMVRIGSALFGEAEKKD
ncbi:MAG: YggS family pyridoxal phosphate-dependent enzyme [Mariprofundaceae bacterium]|nr:YggS family pyridoxal phosphate-dependent enzyme [Mariprofundaceae bacterium]